MKNVFVKIALSILLLSEILSAEEYCYEPCCEEGEYYANVEGLYWTVCHAPIGVARKSNQNNANPEGLTSDTYLFGQYNGGVRGRIGYRTSTFFSDAAYLWFHSREKKDPEIGTAFAMRVAGGPPGFGPDEGWITSEAGFRYQNVDLRFGHYLCHSKCFNSFVYVNTRWVRVDYKNIVSSIDINTPPETFLSHITSKFNGGALGLGVGGHYLVCGNFGIGSTANLLALIGKTDFNFSNVNTTLSYNPFFKKSNHWNHVVPGFEFRLGIDYSCCIWCFIINAEVGYELDWYSNLLNYYSANQPTVASSFNVIDWTAQDIGFVGPFFRLTALF